MPTEKFLTIGRDAKTVKGQKRGFLTGILYLSPHVSGGTGNLCANASPGCIASCLNTAGRGVMTKVQQGRRRKTQLLRKDQSGFMAQLVRDIVALKRKAKREHYTPLVRLNGTSDIPWENLPATHAGNIFDTFQNTQFYDYTKDARRMRAFLVKYRPLGHPWPANYHLTFSRSECNESACKLILDAGGNVAVVFDTKRGKPLPDSWLGYRVIDGDIDDARPSSNVHAANGSACKGMVIGLRAKGRARQDMSGFVVRVRGMVYA